MSQAPPGYTPFRESGGYIGLSGPFYWKKLESADYAYGFHSDERHANPNGVLHGASLVTFVDTLLGHAVVSATGKACATVALTTQFVAGAPVGRWISGAARMRRLTRSMAFLDAEVSDNDSLLMTATAVFRIFEAR